MVYLAEIDGSGSRQEVRRGYASNVLQWWPKWPGVGNVLITSTPTATVYKPGASLDSIGAASVSMATVEGVSRVSITIDTSNTTTYELDENYRCQVAWSYTDSDGVAHSRDDAIRFDVCREPYRPQISLNNLQDMVPDIGQRLLSSARQIKSDRTAEQMASTIGARAWDDVRAKLVKILGSAGKIIPRCILPREALFRITCTQAIRSIFIGNAGPAESESSELALFWTSLLEERLGDLGPFLDYDADDDGAEDETISGPGVMTIARAW